MSFDHLSYREFWETLETKLEQATVEDLRRVLRGMAEGLKPNERKGFLEQLDHFLKSTTKPEPKPESPSLLHKIEALKQEIQEYLDGLDEEDYFEDVYSDETANVFLPFYDAFEELLRETDRLHEDGQDALVVKAYRALFSFVEITDDYDNSFPIHDLDSEESLLRYLHACYMITPPKKRAELLWDELWVLRDNILTPAWFSLLKLENISRRPLPNWEASLDDWIALLFEEGAEDDPHEEAWLREAIRRRHGLEGIIRLAHEQGDRFPNAYLEWFEALRQAGDFASLLVEAEKALQRFPEKHPIRAKMADFLAEAALRQGETKLLRQSRRIALLSEPKLERLLDLWEVLPQAQRAAQMRAIAERFAEELQHKVESTSIAGWSKPFYPTPGLHLYACIFASEWQKALEIARKGKPLGWSSTSRPQGIFIALALMHLAGFSPSGLPQGMQRLWEEVWKPEAMWDSTSSHQQMRLVLQSILEQTFAETHFTPDFESALLNECLQMATDRIEAIVDGLHRQSYHKAAALLVACGETLNARGGDGNGFIASGRKAFPRHRAFQQEVEDILRAR